MGNVKWKEEERKTLDKFGQLARVVRAGFVVWWIPSWYSPDRVSSAKLIKYSYKLPITS